MLKTDATPIDAVITWVDGSRASHRHSRDHYMAQALFPLHENAVNPHRWHNSNEILFCLQSIANYAPWTRTIWIVIDSAPPDLSELSYDLRAKIKFVLHKDIFKEFSPMLPTFNSLAIETLIWRIDGLSERFIYFNDDVFLTAPLKPTDMFRGNRPVLRGKWVDFSTLLQNPNQRDDPAKFNSFMQINAARLEGFDATRVFSSAHVVHPFRRSVMADLCDRHHEAFVHNIKYRFRDLNQFLPQGLHNHACIAARDAVLHDGVDYLHIRSGQGVGRAPSETRSILQDMASSGIKFLCVNDLPQLEAVIPDARDWLRGAVGGFPQVALDR